MKYSMVAALSVALGAWVAFSPGRAEACTGPLGYTCGGIGVVAAPADANTLVFRNAYAPVLTKKLVRSTETPVLRLTSSGGQDVPFAVTADANLPGYWLVKPTTPVQTGERYTLRWEAACTAEEIAASGAFDKEKAAGGSVEVTIPAASPPPTSLGTVSHTGPTRSSGQSCSCSVVRNVDGVEVLPKLDPAMATKLLAYQGMSLTQMTVDGVALDDPPWAQTATACSGAIFGSCKDASETGIGPGMHQVGFRVVIAGVAAPLTAETPVDFTCREPVPFGEGGAPPNDGGATSDASLPAATAESNEVGCGACTASTTGLAGGTLVPLAALLALGAVRRRARK